MSQRDLRIKRHYKIRKVVVGTSSRPRLSVFRSNKFIYAQLIDDSKSSTLASVSDSKLGSKETKINRAYQVGKLLAEKAKTLKINSVVFDRGGYLYHGRVKKLAEGAREGGLIF